MMIRDNPENQKTAPLEEAIHRKISSSVDGFSHAIKVHSSNPDFPLEIRRQINSMLIADFEREVSSFLGQVVRSEFSEKEQSSHVDLLEPTDSELDQIHFLAVANEYYNQF